MRMSWADEMEICPQRSLSPFRPRSRSPSRSRSRGRRSSFCLEGDGPSPGVSGGKRSSRRCERRDDGRRRGLRSVWSACSNACSNRVIAIPQERIVVRMPDGSYGEEQWIVWHEEWFDRRGERRLIPSSGTLLWSLCNGRVRWWGPDLAEVPYLDSLAPAVGVCQDGVVP